MRGRGAAGLACAAALLAAIALLPDPAGADPGPLHAHRVASGLSEPVFVAAPDGDSRLFVVERAGVIRIVENGSVLSPPFLDISSQVSTLDAFGMFGLAFAPDYATSGLFYVYYLNADFESVISRFSVSGDPDVADPTEEVVFTLVQPGSDHNGGTIAFGPNDGFLYFAPGDGGTGPNDPKERAQDPQELLGKMLRLDVSAGSGPASVPSSNPFVGDAGVLDEIWAFGLRNPFRFSFDRDTGDLWIGDVGQEQREEVDLEPAGDPGGRNYGWDVMEGSLCNTHDPAPAPPCNDPSLTLPFYEYGHTGPPACAGSITGGSVHRGESAGPEGLYFFADFCTAQIWTLDPDTLDVVERTAELSPAQGGDETIDLIVGFGEDGAGNLHVVDMDGEIFRIDGVSELLPSLGAAGRALLAAGLLAAVSAWRRLRRT